MCILSNCAIWNGICLLRPRGPPQYILKSLSMSKSLIGSLLFLQQTGDCLAESLLSLENKVGKGKIIDGHYLLQKYLNQGKKTFLLQMTIGWNNLGVSCAELSSSWFQDQKIISAASLIT